MPTTHTYSTPTKHYITTLPLYTYTTVTTYTTPTTPTTQHTQWYTLRTGPAPAHMLNEHVVGHWGCYFLVIKYYVLWHVLVIISCLNCYEPPAEGKSIEFPRKHALLADCTIITRPHTQTTWVRDVSPGVGRTPGELEETRSTEAQYTCRPHRCTKYNCLHIC